MQKKSLDPRSVAITAVMSAVVFALTFLARIPTSGGGYVHLGDAAIFFVSFAFGPWVGGIAAGLGTALADALGYPEWALASFLVHGIQGVVAGVLAWRKDGWIWMIVAVIVGGVVIVGGYFIAAILMGFGQAAAAIDIPANIIQALVGGVVGVPLFIQVRRAYPRLTER